MASVLAAVAAADVAAVTAPASAPIGWGPLQELLDDPAVEEIWWNDPARVFVARAGITELSAVVVTHAESRALVLRAVMDSGRRLDTSQPFVDAQLPDGSRLHVVIPPVSASGWAVNIRRHVLRPAGLADAVTAGMLPADAARLVEAAFRAGANVLVSGGTHTGKTTLLNALLGAVPGQRVVTCEEVRELALAHADWVPLQTRDPGLEGTCGVSLRDLVRESLRMRPQRVVVGEVRGAEALDLLLAMNCGVPAAATIHANSAEDAVAKLTGLPLLAGPNIAPDFVAGTVASCLDMVLHVGLRESGRRVVTQICAVTRGPDGPQVGRIYSLAADGVLRRAGAEVPRSWDPK